MSEREQHLEDRIVVLENGQKQILELLRPISQTYTTVSMLSKWVSATLVLISIIIGIILGLKQLK